MHGPWSSVSLQVCFVFCASNLFIFFPVYSQLNIWGSNKNSDFWQHCDYIFYCEKGMFLCINKKSLLGIGLYFSIGIFICNSAFVEPNTQNYLYNLLENSPGRLFG